MGDDQRSFHLDIDILLIDYVVVVNVRNVIVLHLAQEFDDCKSFSPLFLIERGDVNAGDHLEYLVLHVLVDKNLSISLFEIEDFLHILIRIGVVVCGLLRSYEGLCVH